jgi:hypothetical protein
MRKTLIALTIAIAFIAPASSASASISPLINQVGSSRPSDCPRLWCGCWLRKALARMGYSTHGASNLARAYASYGTRATPGATGSIMVMRGHVGLVVGRCDNSHVKLLSGNHNHRVGVGCYPMRRAIAWRKPAKGYVESVAVPVADTPPRARYNFNR